MELLLIRALRSFLFCNSFWLKLETVFPFIYMLIFTKRKNCQLPLFTTLRGCSAILHVCCQLNMKATVRYSQNQDIKMPSARKLASQEFMNHSRDTKKKSLYRGWTALRPERDSTLKRKLVGKPWKKRKKSLWAKFWMRDKREWFAPRTMIISVPPTKLCVPSVRPPAILSQVHFHN